MIWANVRAALLQRGARFDTNTRLWTCPYCGAQTLRVEHVGGFVRLVCIGKPNIEVGPPTTWPDGITDAA